MKKKLMTALVAGIALFGSMGVGVYAGTGLQEIKANLNKTVTILLNGMEWQPVDKDGKVIYPITYNNTTYLPVRAVGEATNHDVGYIPETKTITLDTLYEGDGSEFEDTAVPGSITFFDGNELDKFAVSDLLVENMELLVDKDNKFEAIQCTITNIRPDWAYNHVTFVYYDDNWTELGSAVVEIDQLSGEAYDYVIPLEGDIKGYTRMSIYVE